MYRSCAAATLTLVALLSAAPVRAQHARATVQASATVVEPLGLGLDSGDAELRQTRGGLRLTVPLSVLDGTTVTAQRSGGAPACEVLAAAEPGASPLLRCLVEPSATAASISGAMTTLVIATVN